MVTCKITPLTTLNFDPRYSQPLNGSAGDLVGWNLISQTRASYRVARMDCGMECSLRSFGLCVDVVTPAVYAVAAVNVSVVLISVSNARLCRLPIRVPAAEHNGGLFSIMHVLVVFVGVESCAMRRPKFASAFTLHDSFISADAKRVGYLL